MLFLRCAQECAQPIVTIDLFGIVELIAPQDISAKAAVFRNTPSEFASTKKNSQDPQVLAQTILAILR